MSAPTYSPRTYGVRRCRGVSVQWYLGTTCPGLEKGRRLLCGRGRRKEAPGPERGRKLGFLSHLLLPSTEELLGGAGSGLGAPALRPPRPSDPGIRTPRAFSLRPGGPGPQPLLPQTRGSRTPLLFPQTRGSGPQAPPPSDPGVWTPSPSSLGSGSPYP